MDNSSVPVAAARCCALLLCALLLLCLHCCGCVGVAGVPVVLWLLLCLWSLLPSAASRCCAPTSVSLSSTRRRSVILCTRSYTFKGSNDVVLLAAMDAYLRMDAYAVVA